MFLKNSKKTILSALVMATLTPLFANEVNVYSHRHYDTDKKLNKMFTEKTGIKVNIVKGKSSALIKRLEVEGEYSPADILVTVDAGRLELAKMKGLLQSVSSDILHNNIPAHLRDPNGNWFGLTKRARVIVYNKNKITPDMLSTYEDLADPKWKGKISIRSSKNIYNQSLLASLISHNGKDASYKWAKGIVDNFSRVPRGNDKDQAKAIVAGIGDVAVMNTYYIGRMSASKVSGDRKVVENLGIFFPNQKGRGTHVNISGAGVTKYSKNRENAIKYIEFLSSKEAQTIYAQANFEYPVLKGVEPSELVKSWGTFKEDSLSMETLGRLNVEAVRVFDKVGWR